MLKVSALPNANVFIDGVSLLGQAAEVTLPEVTAVMSEFKALGMQGTLEVFSGVEKMEATIKWTSFYADVLKAIGNFTKSVQLQLRGNLQEYGAGGVTNEVPYVVMMTATAKKFPSGSFKASTMSEQETSFAVSYLKVSINRVDIIEVDVIANIYKVDGVDVLATYRTNIGA